MESKKFPMDTHFGPEREPIRAIDMDPPVIKGQTDIYLWKVSMERIVTDSIRHVGGSIRSFGYARNQTCVSN